MVVIKWGFRNRATKESHSDSLSFSSEQVEYLRDEFERQRRWVNLLSARERAALEELEHRTH